VRTQRGNTGGYILAAKPEDITVYDIVSAMEDTTRINRCLEDDRYCSRCAVDTCSMYKYFVGLQQEIDNSMKGMTIAELLELKS
jgi:Rrf2 family protein